MDSFRSLLRHDIASEGSLIFGIVRKAIDPCESVSCRDQLKIDLRQLFRILLFRACKNVVIRDHVRDRLTKVHNFFGIRFA